MRNSDTAFSAICPNCEKLQLYSCDLVLSINNTYKNNVISPEFNMITCPLCNCKYRFETDILYYDLHNNFAILGMPNCKESEIVSGRSHLFNFFSKTQMKFRLVRYCIELIEKSKLFSRRLDDKIIEYLKYMYCPTDIKNNLGDNLLLYKDIENGKIIYAVYDDYDNIMDEYTVNFERNYTPLKNVFLEPKNNGEFVNWHKIDYAWVKKFYK